MYLTNLEIVGFKSFASKTNFKFIGGMTALVGPNGCGKTNIVDAIRWVLGEQKSAVLRSDIMEDVIFNGTNKRKPLGMAEVSLVLQNNKRILPIEYSEVTITRRLFRNGESHYLLNNTKCRLRDILDLFLDTGMGADSYSVIELKMVEAILSGKPEERRNLIEEAAGVKKYKARRKETGRKLQNVQNDLLRIQDIVLEVEKQVNALSRQASKTKRFNKLTEQLKSLEINLLNHQYVEFKSKLIIIQAELSQIKNTKTEKENNLKNNESSLNVLKTKLSNLDENYHLASEKENSINSLSAEQSKEIAVSKEKLQSLKTQQDRIDFELNEFVHAFENIDSSISTTEKSLNNIEIDKIKSEKELDEITIKRTKARNSVSDARHEVNIANEDIINYQNKINSALSELDRGRSRKGSLERSIFESKNDIDDLNSKIIKAENEEKSAKGRADDFNVGVNDSKNALSLAQEHQLALQSSIDNIRDDIANNKNKLNSKQSTLEFLTGLIDSNESTKFLFNNMEWMPEAEKITLAEIVAIDDKFRVAVDAALGEHSKYFVVKNRKDAISAISELKRSNKGRSAFICRELVPEVNAPHNFTKREGVFGWVSELVRVDDTMKNILRAILGKTVIVDNIDIAWEEIKKKNCDTAVTIDGELVRSKGIIRGGSKLKSEGLYIGKKERISVLNKEIASLKQSITQLEASYIEVKSEYDSIDIAVLNENLRKVEIDRNNNEQLINQLNYKIESFNQNLLLIEKNNDSFRNEIIQIDKEAESNTAVLREIESKLAIIKEQQTSQSKELKELEGNLSYCEEEYLEAEMKKVRNEQEIISLQKEIDRLNEQKISLQQNEQKRKAEKSLNEKLIAELNSTISDMETQLIEINNNSALAQTEREIIGSQITSIKEQINQYSDDINILRRDYERTVEKIYERELKVNDVAQQMKNIQTRAGEGHDIDLNTTELLLIPDFSIENTSNEVNVLKDKLLHLGNVNFMALEEYETQDERLQFYNRQIADLHDAEQNLIETIDEINQTAQQKFIETFEKVNNHFQDLFRTLFGREGESELQLSEGDPLEANIEIMAKPPGKRPRSIEGLSGGEKTLTAIALLFAIYLVKPSPFCILDEVDAPLDDANIDRFIDLISDFSKDTQFLIVSHNKKTMEAADSLYGITMQEEGVSKVVSVRLSNLNGN